MASHLWISAGILFLALGYALAFTHNTDGDSGEVCGPENRRCLEGHATCNHDTGKCVCNNPPYAYGDGYVGCYRNNTFRTEVFNDPNVLTYNGNSIGLPIPCRYSWTHTKTYLKNKRRERVGYCVFNAYAFHHKDKGKFYVGGYDVAIKLIYDNGTEISMSIRKYGKAWNGDYTYFVNATDGHYLPNGNWNNDVIDFHDPTTNLKINCEFDAENNLAIINAKKCGIRIQFRPYDCVLRRNQPMIPHIAYGVNCAFHPVFLSQDQVVAIPPEADHDGMTIDDILYPGLNREQTLVMRALTSGAAQNSPFPNPSCAMSKSKLDMCDDMERVDAFNYCLWILKSPRFIRCYDHTYSGEYIMALFNSCVDVFCNGGDCSAVIGIIVASGCHELDPSYPMLDSFVDGSYC